MFLYKAPNPIRVHARRQLVKVALNGLHATTGPMREFRQSQARAAGTVVITYQRDGHRVKETWRIKGPTS